MIRLVFFGSSQISATILNYLIQSPEYDVMAVVSRAEATHGHSSQRSTPVAELARTHDLTLYLPQRTRDIREELQAIQAPLGVLFAYGQILSRDTLEIFPQGIVNIHPSLLPLHRGPSPIEATILNGDATAGTSLMLLEEDMDTGPILSQKSWAIDPHISKSDLTVQLVDASRELLLLTLQNYLSGRLVPVAQDDTQATYCQMIKKADGHVDPHSESAQSLERKVRAYAGWPSVSLDIRANGEPSRLQLHAVTILENSSNNRPSLSIEDACYILRLTEGSLRIDSAQLPGRKPISGRDLRNGSALALPA